MRIWSRMKVATLAGPAPERPADHCTCDIFDMGPRCDFCVAGCARQGHLLGHHATGHPDYCFCGAPDGRYDPKEVTA